MKNSWDLFPELTLAVKKDHECKNCGHHPFEHALMVAQYCLLIGNGQTAEAAAAAGLMHNTDRLYPDESQDQLRFRLQKFLFLTPLPSADYINIVIDAVLNHSKPNDPNDSEVLVFLKDADRLANISPFEIIARSARAYPSIPLLDTEFILRVDPESTYRNPKTVLHDALHSTLEWERWLRLPKARELAEPYFNALRHLLDITYRQQHETNLLSYPTPK